MGLVPPLPGVLTGVLLPGWKQWGSRWGDLAPFRGRATPSPWVSSAWQFSFDGRPLVRRRGGFRRNPDAFRHEDPSGHSDRTKTATIATRGPWPGPSWQNGLHLMTKDAPLVTICSHKPRDAPGGGGTGPAGKARYNPGRRTPVSTSHRAITHPAGPLRYHPGPEEAPHPSPRAPAVTAGPVRRLEHVSPGG